MIVDLLISAWRSFRRATWRQLIFGKGGLFDCACYIAAFEVAFFFLWPSIGAEFSESPHAYGLVLTVGPGLLLVFVMACYVIVQGADVRAKRRAENERERELDKRMAELGTLARIIERKAGRE